MIFLRTAKRPVLLVSMSLAAVLLFAAPGTARVCGGPDVWSLFRFLSPATNHYFYTYREAEKNYIIANWPDAWQYEKEVFCVHSALYPYPDLQPVYRFYSDTYQVHFFTIWKEEKEHIIVTYPEHIWRYEGIGWYAWPTMPTLSGDDVAVPVYRFWSPTYHGHFFTTDLGEKAVKDADPLWDYEGIAYYTIAGALPEARPDIQVSAESHDFGTVTMGTLTTWTFTIYNVGAQELVVTDLEGLPQGGFYLENPPEPPFVISPGGHQDVTVGLETDETGSWSAALQVQSNDPDTPSSTVSLTAVVRALVKFGFHLNPVLLNGSPLPTSEKNVLYFRPASSDDRFFSYATPKGIRHVQLPLATGLTKAYPTEEDYRRIKRIGDFVVCNIWLGYWYDPEDATEMRKIIDNCFKHGLLLILRVEDPTRVSNQPNKGPTDETWFQESFEPYLRSIAGYAKGKVFAYQVWNEVWNPERFMLGPTGEKITSAEYVSFLGRCRDILKSEDPYADVLNSGMTSIVEEDFYSRTKDVLDWGVELFADIFNFHYYVHGEVDFTEQIRLIDLSFDMSSDVIITECNHINPYVSDEDKLRAISDVRNQVSKWFRLRAVLVFGWNTGTANTEILPWAIKDTPLEEMLYREYNR